MGWMAIVGPQSSAVRLDNRQSVVAWLVFVRWYRQKHGFRHS
jgi:hypothetical protein